MQYAKPPLPVTDQIALLQTRGLIFNDPASAHQMLSAISYYRLSAYMLPYHVPGGGHQFQSGVTFEQITDLYVFDRQLKLILFDAIERVEIAIRTQVIHQMALAYGSHWHEEPALFADSRVFSELQRQIGEHCQSKNREVFVDHYLAKYTQPPMPPCWMSLELISMGQLSQVYKALKNKANKKIIAGQFGLYPPVFESWSHAITYVRNICAHHARLWNRDLGIQPAKLLSPQKHWINPAYNNNRRIYYFLAALKYLLLHVNPGGHFTQRILDLLATHPNIPHHFMGFYPHWQNEPLWKA